MMRPKYPGVATEFSILKQEDSTNNLSILLFHNYIELEIQIMLHAKLFLFHKNYHSNPEVQ